MRGTTEAYLRLLNSEVKPDDDTLYFISKADSDDVTLYLGSKMIAGSDAESGPSFEFDDALADKQILIYDAIKKAWVNTSLNTLITDFTGATELASGQSGLVPAPELGETNLFLRSDGTWAALDIPEQEINNQIILTLSNNEKLPHADVITNGTENLSPSKGDIIIIEENILEDKNQYIVYIFTGEEWLPLDGNYNANGIYFEEDLTEVIAAGQNLSQVLDNIVAKTLLSSDDKSISINNNVLSLYNYGTKYYRYVASSGTEGEEDYSPAHYEIQVVDEDHPWISGLEPRVTLEDNVLVLGWYEQNPTTIDGINASISTLQTGLEDLSNSVGSIKEEIGKPANTETGEQATGLYSEIETQIAHAVNNAEHLRRKILNTYEELELYIVENDDADQYIFMIPIGVNDYDNKYDEYIVINGSIEPVGNWSIDLDDYVKKDELLFTAVNNNHFEITNSTLILKPISMESVTGLTELNTQVGSLRTDVTSLQTIANTLQTNYTSLSTKVGNLETSVSKNTEDVKTINETIASMQAILNSLDTTYVSIESFEKIVGNMDELLLSNETISAQIDEIRTQLTWQSLT